MKLTSLESEKNVKSLIEESFNKLEKISEVKTSEVKSLIEKFSEEILSMKMEISELRKELSKAKFEISEYENKSEVPESTIEFFELTTEISELRNDSSEFILESNLTKKGIIISILLIFSKQKS